jgi:hypothetical protein
MPGRLYSARYVPAIDIEQQVAFWVLALLAAEDRRGNFAAYVWPKLMDYEVPDPTWARGSTSR